MFTKKAALPSKRLLVFEPPYAVVIKAVTMCEYVETTLLTDAKPRTSLVQIEFRRSIAFMQLSTSKQKGIMLFPADDAN